MSRFNRKGSVTKGGRKRIHRDRKGQPLPSKTVQMATVEAKGLLGAFNSKPNRLAQERGISLTRRQLSKFRNGYGALHRAINHA